MSLPYASPYPVQEERERPLFHLQPNERGSRACYLSLEVETLISMMMEIFLGHHGDR